MTSPLTLRRALALSLVLGLLAWIVLWFGTSPRAGWDSLVYHKYAFEYAGVDREEQDSLSWDLFTRYASPDLVLYVTGALAGEAWHFDVQGTDQERWGLQYRMRPAYPAIVAAAYPFLGSRAPLAASALAVVLFVMTTFVGLYLLAGIRVAVIAAALGILNVLFTPWLVALMTDGLAISLWAVTLTAGALWIEQRRPAWLLVLGAAVLALCLTRPLGVLAPGVFGLCALGAGIARAHVWRGFALATIGAAIPAVVVTLLFAAQGFPGLWDLLQDLPTVHFSEPDVADPLGWIIAADLRLAMGTLPLGLLARPLVLAALVGSIAGLLMTGRWWSAPFLAAFPIVLATFLLHPVLTELDRTLAPAWVSVHTGLALLLVLGAIRWRPRILTLADRLTRPEGQMP